MTTSSLWRQIGVLCLGFVLLNLFAKRFMHGSVPHLVIGQIHSHPNPTHVFVGSSVVEGKIRTDVVEAQIPHSRPLNIAIGATRMPESYLLLNQVKLSSADRPRIYLGFFDQQLTEIERLTWSDLMANRSVCYMTNINEAVRLIAPNDPVLNCQMRLTALSPLLIERGTLWNRVEIMRRKFGDLGKQPRQEENFAALENSDAQGFALTCETSVQQKTPFTSSIQGIIDIARKNGAKLYFLEMPMPSQHRETYYNIPQWSAYRNYVQKLAKKQGVEYVDCSTWLADKYFHDRLHMNGAGADIFTAKLVSYMKNSH